jgi:tetratricopeptide (TPR) repeat protein
VRARGQLIAVLVVAVLSTTAHGQPDDGSERFRSASALRIEGDLAGAAAAFIALADELPSSPWADDARMEAAILDEQRGDYPRARRQLERLLAEHPGSRLVRRARARLEQITRATGAGGEWSAVAARHDELLRAAAGAEDPTPSIEALEALVRASPGYPRAHDARIWIADSWLRQGDGARARPWYRDALAAAPDERARFQAGKALGDALVTAGDLDGAATTYRQLRAAPGADGLALDEAEALLAQARTRALGRTAAWIALGALLVLVVAALRRDAGSWRGAARALVRPPVEVLYFAPVAALLIAGGHAGNRIVARAVLWIVVVGAALAWLSGASLDAAGRRPGAARIVGHVLAAAIAIAAVGYLAVTKDRLLDMLVQTWQHGHDSR